MRTLGNILWHIPFLGFLNALFTFLIGGLFVISVIGAPIGLGLIQLSKFYLAPFTHAMVDKSDLKTDENPLWKAFGIIVWIVYLPFGLILCFCSLCGIVGSFISIIGIPVALAAAKSLGTLFRPVGKICVPVAVRDEMNRRKAQEQVNQYMK